MAQVHETVQQSEVPGAWEYAGQSSGYLSALYRSEWLKYYSSPFPLSEKYPLVEFKYLVFALSVYALMCLWGKSRRDSKRPPLMEGGREILQVYNFCQVILSAYLTYLVSSTYMKTIINTGLVCQPMKVNIADDPERYELETFTIWLFYISKWVDYFDTFFIIARGKWRQFSFLHVFHHSSMIGLTWIAAHYHPCGYFLIAAQLNAPVHLVMYFYYFLSSFPSLVPYLWFKNYITTLQLIQFVTGTTVSCYCLWGAVKDRMASGISIFFTSTFVFYGIALFSLFYNFYLRTYKSKKSTPDKKTK